MELREGLLDYISERTQDIYEEYKGSRRPSRCRVELCGLKELNNIKMFIELYYGPGGDWVDGRFFKHPGGEG